MSSNQDSGRELRPVLSVRSKNSNSADQLDRARSLGGELDSPRLRSSSKHRKHKPRPPLKGSVSHLVFSVDDDITEDADEEDISIKDGKGEYLEGYNAALKALYLKRSKNAINSGSGFFSEGPGEGKSSNLRPDISRQLSKGDGSDNHQPLLIDDVNTPDEHLVNNPDDNAVDQDPENYDDNDSDSMVSSSSLESLNLKDRQDAINTTHPFGIKIWKPSLYKKKRSVATKAEEDIHEFSTIPSRVYLGVHITNALWSFTIGIFLFLLCSLGGVILSILSIFPNRHSRLYASLLFNLGRYWLFPFGKFVLLNKDEHYMDEDGLDGRSISEFHRWRLEEEGRLFFAPPRRLTNSQESRPLLKDHKGRPLRDTYTSTETIPDEDFELSDLKVRFFGRGDWSVGRLVFYLFFYTILQPVLFITGIFSWLFVFTIPMANITSTISHHLRRHPLALKFEFEKDYLKKNPKKHEHQLILLCTYRCCAFHYYKYTIDGTNIFFINLLAAVLFVIGDYYILKEKLGWTTWFTNDSFLFCACLFSIIPLAYFIGQAVASISAQSSMGVGAVINAFFSTVVEIFLYCVALDQAKGKLVEGSMIGSILGGVLLLPGLSMCGGAFKRKTQRYNPRSAGVSSTMLLFAVVVMFAPSLFYQIYGSYEIKCKSCDFMDDDCATCRFIQPRLNLDPLYYSVLKPYSLIVALTLFLAYICGLFFTLRTHASLIWATASHETERKDDLFRSPSLISLESPHILPKTNVSSRLGVDQRNTSKLHLGADGTKIKSQKDKNPLGHKTSILEREDEEVGGHDAPNWSRSKSTVILLSATLLYAVIAEILVQTVDTVLINYPIDPKFLGLTVFALVPNTTEFLNAISFALGGNVALSMEIGSAYALQVVLIQIPCLVIYSIFKGFDTIENIFSLIFPRWDIIATLISIYLFTYIYAGGKSNYFKGVILILIYVVVMTGFWFNNVIEDLDDGYQ